MLPKLIAFLGESKLNPFALSISVHACSGLAMERAGLGVTPGAEDGCAVCVTVTGAGMVPSSVHAVSPTVANAASATPVMILRMMCSCLW